ncbi:outer membrane receptor for ferrienterochelin and colicins [Ereboglobus sp. PH5-5]|uniref:TonB-dependent receptor plug domain-containing protein n=1 Tax=Ereboglobus sp. PH5-5 TaxID=2940529 RepID=UPI002405C202|nr:TonB-dependent receptor [Ereboglobus sp. PH5-5]MDF9831855.1 outer membrane receptor for ferrienterochelin and colicins [Ereboglobus sp. PH5-5]
MSTISLFSRSLLNSNTARCNIARLVIAIALIALNSGVRGATRDDDDVINLDRLTVSTGTRTERLASDAPVKTEFFLASEIKAHGGVTLADSLRLIPSARFESNCSNCGLNEIQLLGLSTDYTAILFDGAPLYSGLAKVYGADLFPTIFIDRIEIVKGSSSVLYGPEAVAGVVNLITTMPTHNHTSALLSYSNLKSDADEWKFTFKSSWLDRSGKLALTAYGLWEDRDGLDLTTDGFTELPEFESKVGGLQFYYRPDEDKLLKATYQYIDQSHRGGDRLDLPEEQARVAESLAHKIHMLNLQWDHQLTPALSYSLRGSYLRLRRDAFYGARADAEFGAFDEAGGFADPGNPTPAEEAALEAFAADPANQSAINDVAHRIWSDTRNQVVFLDAQVTQKLGAHELVYGAQYRYEKLKERRPYDSSIADTSDDFATYGFFAQDIWTLRPGLELVPGVRVDRHDNVGGAIFSPRVALRYQPVNSLTLRASYAAGFNAPGAYNEDLHIGVSSGGAIFLRNSPDLEEERSDSFTLGADWLVPALGKRLILSSTVHYTFLHDTFDIDDSDVNGTGIWERVNGPDARVFVWENGFQWMAAPGLRLEGSVSYIRARFDDPIFRVSGLATREFVKRPEWTGKFSVTYDCGAGWQIVSLLNYTGGMLAVGEEADIHRRTPKFWELDLNLSKTFRLSTHMDLKIGVGVRNLFDDRQDDLFDNGEDRDPTYFYGPVRPRTLFATAGIEF